MTLILTSEVKLFWIKILLWYRYFTLARIRAVEVMKITSRSICAKLVRLQPLISLPGLSRVTIFSHRKILNRALLKATYMLLQVPTVFLSCPQFIYKKLLLKHAFIVRKLKLLNMLEWDTIDTENQFGWSRRDWHGKTSRKWIARQGTVKLGTMNLFIFHFEIYFFSYFFKVDEDDLWTDTLWSKTIFRIFDIKKLLKFKDSEFKKLKLKKNQKICKHKNLHKKSNLKIQRKI